MRNEDFESYQQNRMLKSAVEREFLIIGEAVNKICKIDSNIKISSKIEIIGMRNRIVHGYDTVSNMAVWDTIEEHLPRLKEEVKKLMSL